MSKDPDVDHVSFLVAVALWLMEHSHMVIVFNLLPCGYQTNRLSIQFRKPCG